MNTQQIIADLEHAMVIIAADPSPARKAAAAVLLRAAADALENDAIKEPPTTNH